MEVFTAAEEICKRSAQSLFVVVFFRPLRWFNQLFCIFSLRCVTIHLFFRNMCIFCKMFNWQDSDFISGRISMSQQYFIKRHRHRHSDVRKTTISLLFKLLRPRDNYLVFSGDFNFNHSDFLTLINYVLSV